MHDVLGLGDHDSLSDNDNQSDEDSDGGYGDGPDQYLDNADADH